MSKLLPVQINQRAVPLGVGVACDDVTEVDKPNPVTGPRGHNLEFMTRLPLAMFSFVRMCRREN